MNMISFFFSPCNGVQVELNWEEKTEVLGENPVPVPIYPLQIPHGLTRDRTRASAVAEPWHGRNNNLLHLQWMGRRSQTEKEWKKGK
jgi:hypothetical protein